MSVDLVTPQGECFLNRVNFFLDDDLSHYENRNHPQLGTLLDPRFKKKGFQNSENLESTIKHLQMLVTNTLKKVRTDSDEKIVKPETLKRDILDFLNENKEDEMNPKDSVTADAIILVETYLKSALAPRDSNPLRYWYENRLAFDSLLPTVLGTLCIPGSSVPCERLFSHSGYIVTARRNRLDPSTVQMLTVLNLNFRFVLQFFEREKHQQRNEKTD